MLLQEARIGHAPPASIHDENLVVTRDLRSWWGYLRIAISNGIRRSISEADLGVGERRLDSEEWAHIWYASFACPCFLRKLVVDRGLDWLLCVFIGAIDGVLRVCTFIAHHS